MFRDFLEELKNFIWDFPTFDVCGVEFLNPQSTARANLK